MRADLIPDPWRAFLIDIDNELTEDVVLHCIGGFAIAMLYGLPRPTVDIDYLNVRPLPVTELLGSIAGRGSRLHAKQGVYLERVTVATVPESYEDRLVPIFPGAFRRLNLFGLEAHDLALSKLERNSGRDREDVKFLARSAPLDLPLLQRRYDEELRPYLANTARHDLTLRLWIEMLSGG